MAKVTVRDLSDPQAAHAFLVQEMGYPPEDSGTISMASAIAKAEAALPKADGQSSNSTLHNRRKRHKAFRTDNKRDQLHNQIIRELFHNPRLESDDEIRFGTDGGGCRPAVLHCNRQAFLVIGPPAAGKSSICTPIADLENALIIDSDYAKRKLPEYESGGAALVHEESQILIDGDPSIGYHDCLLDRALDQRANFVYPRVGRDLPDIMGTIARINEFDYDIHLILAHCTPKEATDRALHRFLRSRDHRYVPLGYIYDVVGQHPLVNYLQLRMQGECKSFEAYDNNVAKSDPPRRITNWSDRCAVRITHATACESDDVEYEPIKGFEKARESKDVTEGNDQRVTSANEGAEPEGPRI